MSSVKRDRLSKVVWYDIVGESAWQSAEDAVKSEPIRCETVGWVIHETKAYLVVAAARGKGIFGDVNAIPRGCIESVEGIDA